MRPFEVHWKNIRSFEDTGRIPIRPLTILLGPNSSGKTSFLLPFLLLKQTLDARDNDVALNSRGQLVNGGSYEDLAYRHDPDLSIGFEFRFQPIRTEKPEGDVGSLPPVRGSMSFSRGSYPGDVDLGRYELADRAGRVLLRRKRRKTGSYTVNDFVRVARNLLEDGILLDEPSNEGMDIIRADRPSHFMFDARRTVRALITSEDEDDEPSELENSTALKSQPRAIVFAYLAVCQAFASRLGALLEDISYVGPIRARFKRVYEVSGEAPANVGVEGEFTPEVIYQQQTPELLSDINAWMRRFDFEGKINAVRAGSDAFQVVTGSGQQATNIADVGFGASQVLPLVVQVLTGPDNGLIIAEQPEIHLNPRLQTRLGDLFASAVSAGKGVLLETHSEHLLIRIRRLIAEGKVDHNDVTLLYVERKEGTSNIREVPIEPDGHIDNDEWPAGFFEDALAESLALASAQAEHENGSG